MKYQSPKDKRKAAQPGDRITVFLEYGISVTAVIIRKNDRGGVFWEMPGDNEFSGYARENEWSVI